MSIGSFVTYVSMLYPQNSLSFKERAGVRMGRCRIFDPIPTLILPLKGRKLV
jgi:hypothetical protein